MIVGLGPEGPGKVLILSIAYEQFGGNKLFSENDIKAFFTGKIPTDYKSLKPKILISTTYSLKLTVSIKLT